ncbi:MAG: J domain-containing protein [Hyphomicrobiaceae bacterium]
MFSNEDARKKILVRIVRSDGETLAGNLLLPLVADLARTMNNDSKFLEFEDFSGNVRLLAKSSILELQSETLKAKVELKNTDPDPSADPYALLGLPKAASWADVRKKYLQLTKRYHPDQYSTVDLPEEVVQYMSGVFSQSNTAYNLIKSTMAKSEAA